jgi:hypothetical protein
MRAMKWLLTCVVAVAAVALPSLAVAGGSMIRHSDSFVIVAEAETSETVTLTTLIPGLQRSTPISNEELAVQRGGVSGMSFSVHFDGMINDTPGRGVLRFVGPNGVIGKDDAPNWSDNNSGSEVQSFLGSVGPFQGVGQWAIVNGDGNTVSNHLTVNIFVTDENGTSTTFTDVLSLIDVTGP